MLTYGDLGKDGPRLGNQLFFIASTYGIGKTLNLETKFPYWKYTHYLKNRIPHLQKVANPIKVNEVGYHYTPEMWEREVNKHPGRLISLNGWLQTEEYWKPYKNEIKDLFEFKDDLKTRLLTKYNKAFSKTTIAISIRRGDFVNNPNYAQLPISYYIGALLSYFPDFKNYNIFCFSDDIAYCRHQFECLDNVYYPTSESDIEQLCLMTMCQHFIISQSTFSWWGAYLGEKPDSVIVRPNYNLDGPLLATHNEKDYWPKHWNNIYDHQKEKIDLLDTTFTIPVHYDHEDRSQNLKLTVKYLQYHFNTNIIVGEQGGNHFSKISVDKYIKFDLPNFHRTKMLNEMAQVAETEIVVNWDADVIAPVMQIVETVQSIRDGADMAYPYGGTFARVGRKQWYNQILNNLDTGIWTKERFNGMRPTDTASVGGAVFFKRDSFFDGGLENENFISYAPEDQERWHRFKKLDYNVLRIKGPLYHIDHFVGPNSFIQHPLYKDNEKEFLRIRALEDLRSEVNTWPWYHKYSTKYYNEIMDDSTESRDELFKVPVILEDVTSIIDVGCGLGHWGKNLDIPYKGIDYRIPDKMLVIPKENYAEYDLTSNKEFPIPGKYDLALCLEVLEHIPEAYASKAIQLLTSLSDKILFSAAVPGQGGVNHVNEQWQTYWANLFQTFGYYPVNLPIKNNPKIAIWYRNNAVLYVNYPTNEVVEDYVHPQLYTNIVGTHTKWKNLKSYSPQL